MVEFLLQVPLEILQLTAMPDLDDPASLLFYNPPDDPLDPKFQISVLVMVDEVQCERWDTNYNGRVQ